MASVVLADGAISPEDLPAHIRADVPSAYAAAQHGPDTPLNLREIKEWAGREAQKRVIQELQKRSDVSRQEVARLLGVDPKTLRSRLKELAGDPSRTPRRR